MEHVDALLKAPPTDHQVAYFQQITAGRGLEVRLDAGGGKGKGVFACKPFEAESLLFFEQPLAAIQHSASRRQAWVCSHCLRFIGSVEQQLARVLLAAQDDDAASESSEEPQSEGSASEGCPASGVEDAALQALASGALRLPCSDAAPLPQPVRCRGRCSEDWYCSKACEAAAWDKCHQLLCTGAAEQENGQQRAAEAGSSGAARAKGKRPAADVVPGYARADAAADPAVARQRAEALMAFNDFADGTNDVFRLAAKVVAATLLAAERQLAADASSGVHGTSASASASANSAAADPERCWAALGHAWLPFAVGHKGLWWECTAAPPEAAEDMRALAEDALQLLVPALPAPLLSRYPALLSLEVWGSIIGMFEMNNLSVYVASPLQRWLEALEALPGDRRAAAEAEAGPYLSALPEELPGCEGNAFYALHSCLNHSCEPSVHAWKREEDLDGSAVILALRDIQPGEEVTISYVDEEAGLEERRADLADYGFVCGCSKCEAEEEAG